MLYILYNGLSKSGKNKKILDELIELVKKDNKEYEMRNIIEINCHEFLKTINDDDEAVIVGGDGTVHHVANQLKDHLPIKQNLYLFAAGTGNDFIRNINQPVKQLVRINDYLKDLPTVTVNGEDWSFVNGAGIGVDAMVCLGVNAGNSESKSVYTKVTLKSFLTYKPCDMDVEIDGEMHHFKKCWVCVAMNGECQGGGLMFAPGAKVDVIDVDFLCLHNCGRLKTFLIFAHLMAGGKHLKFKKNVFYKKAKDIKVVSSEELPFQKDGETIDNVKEIRVRVKG